MYLNWRENSEANVNMTIQCCQKAAMKIHRIFYCNQVAGMTFHWTDNGRDGEDEINMDIICDVAIAKRIMSVYHQYKALTPVAPKFKSGTYECMKYPDPHNKIGAIKMIREVTGMGLKEAKEFSEGITFHFGEIEVQKLTEMGFTLRLVTPR